MRKTIRGAAVLMVASALAASLIGVSAAGAAPARHPDKTSQTIALSARSHHHHYRHYRHYYHYHHGNGRAALRMFGAMAGMIGALAARDECRDYGGCYYGYAYPPRHYYYGPGYYYPPY